MTVDLRVSLRQILQLSLVTALLLSLLLLPTAGLLGEVKVLPAGERPADGRLKPLKDLDGYFPFEPSQTLDDWQQRADRLRRQILVSQGLWPMPTKTPANAVVHGLVERDGYTVERVYFESFPGHFVTGNLYRPKGRTGKLPAVLCPHGHWANGRFYENSVVGLHQELVIGAERFDPSGRYPLQARCVQLARMGCVVFHYDMVGYADSQQLPQSLIHGFRKQRPEMATDDNWGYFSPQAESRLQNVMGLQTYNSIRALDWVSDLPDVDATRIAVTGASGGGTQTFLLCAIDPRPRAAFPAVMVSTAMQGGCTCENSCYLRVDTGNIELAALIAPRPLGMTGADDWTREIMTKGLPELKKHYELLGAADNVMAKALVHFQHNYNYPSRAVMYSFFNRHLQLGQSEPVVEQDFQPLTMQEMTVWDESHPTPPAGDEYERSLLKWIDQDSQKQIAAVHPKDEAKLKEFRSLIGGAVDILVGHSLRDFIGAKFDLKEETSQETYRQQAGLLRHDVHGQELPAVILQPAESTQTYVIWLDPRGKSSMFTSGGQPVPEVEKLLSKGATVLGLDLLCQGEFQADGQPLEKAPLVATDREFIGFTYGYNHPLFSKRVHDVLLAVAYAHSSSPDSKISIYAGPGAGHWATAAAAQAGDATDRLLINTAGFRFAKLTELTDPDFLPGAVKYGDLPAMLALSAPRELWVVGEPELPEIVHDAYTAAGAKSSLKSSEEVDAAEAAEWLTK